MEISFSQSFLDNLERIDNKVVIDGFSVDSGEIQTSFQIVCHGKNIQICVEGVSGECGRLDFYCGEEIGFWITSEGIAMNPERTIFDFNLTTEPKAIIECPWVTEDTEFLEGIGPELGNSLYKDIPVSDGSLVWKETLGKYVVDRGLQDNHLYDVELLDTKSGILEERPIRFKSYQGITIEQGNWEVEMVKKSAVVKHDVYDNISSASYLVWDSPMSDAKVNLSKDPECIDRLGEYVDPGNIIYGNTDCFQFTNYNSSLVGFRVTGTVGSDIEVLFNRESSSGNFTTFHGTIEEEGFVEIRFSDLPYLHFNGIRAVGPSRVTKIETIMYLEEIIDEYSLNPDKTYVARLDNETCIVRINGVCDYIEYEKYLGEINEIGRGSEHIDSVPGITITQAENGAGGLSYEIKSLEKQVKVNYNSGLDASIRYAILQVRIDNNIIVDGNTITTSPLTADYKIKIEQTGIIWKINNSPDYINIDEVEGEHGIFLLNYKKNSNREIEIITNDPRALDPHYDRRPELIPDSGWQEVFSIISPLIKVGKKLIDGEEWMVYKVSISTKEENTGDTWRPKKPETEDPYLISINYLGSVVVSFYAIQLKNIENPISIWEETIIPGQYTKADSKVTLLNAMTKNFIVTKVGSGSNEEEENLGANWYYYDLLGTNKFYITDQNFQTTNVGLEYLVTSETTILNLGTGKDRETVGRVINVNRSDLIGSIGTLVVTESPAYPSSWRSLIDNNTVTIEVERVLDNIYIQVGGKGETPKNEDYEVEVNSICAFPITVNSNFKYIIQTYGYLRIYPEESFESESGYDLPKKKEVFKGYNDNISYTFALIELDEDKEMEDSYIEIRSGSILRKITLKVVGPEKEHDYLFYYPNMYINEETNSESEPKPLPVNKPNLIRIFENGTIVPGIKNTFLYTSTTTPKIEVSGINNYSGDAIPMFYSYEEEEKGKDYGYHSSEVPILVPNSKSLTYSKYPMKSFGYIREMSQDYSDDETRSSIGTTSYLEYPLYMKGKEHFLWCVDNLGSFSNISDPTFPEDPFTDPPETDSVFNMVLSANRENGKTIYVVSRYDINNRTFITEYPEETEFKIKRDELEANIKILPQQTISLDRKSQIEYAIPIEVSCNVENNNGNIFLGSLEYKAKTRVTDDSLDDVIEVDDNIVDLEEIDGKYIKDYITSDKTQNLSIRIFQLGTNKTAFGLYSTMPEGLWINETSNYIIPQIGSDYTITNFTVIMTPLDPNTSGKDICYIDSIYDDKYFLIKITSTNRINQFDGNWYDYTPNTALPKKVMDIVLDNRYSVWIKTWVSTEESEHSEFKELFVGFTKYGCNYGLYVDGKIGFGDVHDDTYFENNFPEIEISNEGGEITINAGIFYAVNGIEPTEALTVPAEYKFIGENQPLEFSWVNGNLDDEGNLRIVLPPRTRDEDKNKNYILQVTQPHEYYPINLYVKFYQKPLRLEEGSDIEKENYKIMFLEEEIDIWSDGTVVGTESKEYKVKFVHNLSKDIFEKNVYFAWYDPVETPSSGGEPDPNEEEFPGGQINSNKNYVYLDDLSLEEIERSYEEGYVKFRFKPNGSRYFIDSNIAAFMRRPGLGTLRIGKVKVKQGYYCLNAEYHHPSGEEIVKVQNHLSRKSPKELRLYKIGTPPRGYYDMTSDVPCKSNNDNSLASFPYCTGRGVLKLTAYRREYNEETETEYKGATNGTIPGVTDIIRNIELLSISPDNIFESYGISYVSVSDDNDYDAKVDPRFNSEGEEYVQIGVRFNEFIPYLEILYTLKEEYIRDYTTFGVNCKITIAELDTGNLCDYYFSLTNCSNKSDEPQNVDLLEFSDYSLKYDCKGGTKQVSFNPASFGSMLRLTKIENDSWITATLLSNSNYISFTAKENESTEDDLAYYRTTQVKIDVKDSEVRNNVILKSFYIDLEQEPDIQQTSGEGKVPSNIYVNVKLVNSTGKQVPITGEIKMYVSGHNGIYINLPGAKSSSTLMTLAEGEETLGYFVNCVGNGVDPSNYLGQSIESRVIVYAPDGGDHNSRMIGATISGNSGVFSNNASYVITLNNYYPAPDPPINISIKLQNTGTEDVYITGHQYISVLTSDQSDWAPINIDFKSGVTSESAGYLLPAGKTAILSPSELNIFISGNEEPVSKYYGGSIFYDSSGPVYWRVYSWTDASDPAVIKAEPGSFNFTDGGMVVFNITGIEHSEGTITPSSDPIDISDYFNISTE